MRRDVSVILRLSGVNGVFLGVFLATSALASAGMDERASVVPGNLYAKALEDGSVRVIVQLKVAALPEGQLGSGDAVALQRQAIAVRRSRLISMEGRFLRQDAAGSFPLSPGSKYRRLFKDYAPGVLPPDEYRFSFLVRDCTNTKFVVLPEFVTFRVVVP